MIRVMKALMKKQPAVVPEPGTTEMFPAFYLGFQPVAKKKGKDLILKALQKNVNLRGEREQNRKLVGIPKSCTVRARTCARVRFLATPVLHLPTLPLSDPVETESFKTNNYSVQPEPVGAKPVQCEAVGMSNECDLVVTPGNLLRIS